MFGNLWPLSQLLHIYAEHNLLLLHIFTCNPLNFIWLMLLLCTYLSNNPICYFQNCPTTFRCKKNVYQIWPNAQVAHWKQWFYTTHNAILWAYCAANSDLRRWNQWLLIFPSTFSKWLTDYQNMTPFLCMLRLTVPEDKLSVLTEVSVNIFWCGIEKYCQFWDCTS